MKKKCFWFLILISAIIVASSPTQAATKFGEADIKKGNVVVVRSGRLLLYTQANNPVTIFENDTIRTMENSAMTLLNPDQNRITLGANAIMQVKRWKKKSDTGTVRMLFGKFRARTTALRKKKSLNIRTATATIGIKGSLAEGVTNSNFTSVANLGGNIDMGGTDIPTGTQAFKVDDGLPDLSGQSDNPNYNPGQSEDSQETGNTGQLDTADSKTIKVSPAIDKIIKAGVKKVTPEEVTQRPPPAKTTKTFEPPIIPTIEPGDLVKDTNAKIKIKFED
jgi:hypothetical protein